MRNLLISGGTGTFGREIVRHILNNDFFGGYYDKIVVYSRNEYKQFQFKNNLKKEYGELSNKVRFIIGDVRDYQQLLISLKDIDEVIHTASLKHIDICEYNPLEAKKTIIDGTINICNASIESGVKKVLFLSTDKAISPINIYGASKMVAEKYTIFSNSFSNGTILSACRWGNVLASDGSIIQTLSNQKDGVVNITDKNMTRFFLLLKDAVNLCFYALNNAVGGEIFILESKAINIERLAKLVIPSAQINYIGIRPGEKIHERLLNESEVKRLSKIQHSRTKQNYYIILPEKTFWGNGKYNIYKKNMVNETEERFVSGTAEQFTDKEILKLIEKDKSRIK